MIQEMRGTIQGGGVVLTEPLNLPDGTEVIVSLIPHGGGSPTESGGIQGIAVFWDDAGHGGRAGQC